MPVLVSPEVENAGAVTLPAAGRTGAVMFAEPLMLCPHIVRAVPQLAVVIAAVPLKFVPLMALAVVKLAAEPVVFWLPAVLTPGKLMLAVPLKDTPPIVRAFWSAVAVAALPVVELEVVAFPLRAAVIVPALKLPDASRATIVLLVLALVALDVTVKVEAPA
jgi:hypothetical protein